jgi:hypothetical protein
MRAPRERATHFMDNTVREQVDDMEASDAEASRIFLGEDRGIDLCPPRFFLIRDELHIEVECIGSVKTILLSFLCPSGNLHPSMRLLVEPTPWSSRPP